METFQDRFKKLQGEAKALGITTRELARRRHIEALRFAEEQGSQYAHIARAALEKERF